MVAALANLITDRPEEYVRILGEMDGAKPRLDMDDPRVRPYTTDEYGAVYHRSLAILSALRTSRDEYLIHTDVCVLHVSNKRQQTELGTLLQPPSELHKYGYKTRGDRRHTWEEMLRRKVDYRLETMFVPWWAEWMAQHAHRRDQQRRRSYSRKD